MATVSDTEKAVNANNCSSTATIKPKFESKSDSTSTSPEEQSSEAEVCSALTDARFLTDDYSRQDQLRPRPCVMMAYKSKPNP